MSLRDFFTPDAIGLNLSAADKSDALTAMVGLLHVDDATTDTLHRVLLRREQLGSTGVGRGIAIPHCRSPVIPKLRLAFGRIPAGLPYDAIDDAPVHFLFLIVAPPIEVNNQYLPVLGALAQFAKGDDIPERLSTLSRPEEFFALLDEKGA